jgi:pilin isopeptide linkage protein
MRKKPVKRIRQIVTSALAALFAALTVLSSVMTALAWSDFTQSRTNDFRGTVAKTTVTLHKYEKTPEGDIIARPVANAEFQLYRGRPGDTSRPIGGTYTTDKSGKITVEKLNSGNYYFEETNPGYGYEYDKDGEGKDVALYPFVITPEDASGLAIVEVEAYNRRLRGSLEIIKTVEIKEGAELTEEQRNELLSSQEFEFTVAFGDGGDYKYKLNGTGGALALTDGKLRLKHGEKAVFESLPAGLSCTVTETPAEGYASKSENHQGTIPAGGKITASFTNTYGETPEPGEITLTVEKKTAGTVPDTDKGKLFWFTLTVDNGEPIRFSLTAGEKKSYKIPAGLVFSVTEDDYFKDGYLLSSVVGGSGTAAGTDIAAVFTNTYIGTEWITVEGEKTWAVPEGVSLPISIEVYLMNGEKTEQIQTVKPDGEKRWKYSFTAPKQDKDGKVIQYTVDEKEISGYIKSVSGDLKDGFTITNTYVEPVLADPPVVRKVITGDKPAPARDFDFKLTAKDGAPMPEGSSGNEKTVTLTGEGEMEFGSIRFVKPGTYVYTITENMGTAQGYTYDRESYTLTFVIVMQGNKLVVQSKTLVKASGGNSDKAVFTNTYDKEAPPTEEITVSGTKTWNHGDNPNRPDSVTVQVKNGGTVIAEKTVAAADNWKYSFTLPKYDADGKEIRYTIDEVEVSGYSKAVNGYDLTNTFNESSGEEVTVSGTKTWNHGDNPVSERPGSITVYILTGGTVDREITVTEADGWKWSAQLPKYDKAGKEIRYTVDEDTVPRYTHKVNGYDLVNTYKGKNYPGDLPKTGDDGIPRLWLVLLCLSSAGLIITLTMGVRQRGYRGKYYRTGR